MLPASPNHSPRRGGLRPQFVVLHFTGMTDAAAARARLCDPAAEVSAHWLVCEDGSVEALVPEHRRAWHAGAGSWCGLDDINSRSVGIEIVNPGDRPYAAAQMDALEDLLAAVLARWSLSPEAVIGHSDMAPGRKSDPGPRFDWRRLALRGLSIWPAEDEARAEQPTPAGREPPLTDSLGAIGYPTAAVEPAVLLGAFRMRFRPGVSGPEDLEDRRLAAAVARLLNR